MKILNRELFTRLCKEATLNYFGSWQGEVEKKEEPVLSRKAQMIRQCVIDGDFECRTDTVLRLMSLVLEEDLGTKKKKKSISFSGEGKDIPFIGVVAVLSKNSTSHNYGIGKPFLLIESNTGLRIDLQEGNCLPSGIGERAYYPPTEKEFDSFLKCICDQNDLCGGTDFESDFPVSSGGPWTDAVSNEEVDCFDDDDGDSDDED